MTGRAEACAWPGEYVDDKQSRFINERAHGNIQRDGTYSLVPRIWGGVTTPQELRAIAEKFQVPTRCANASDTVGIQ
jgi:nitrite reductase (NADH) large subunit